MVHSLNFDLSYPNMMLVKLDIEKAYDTLSRTAILATLTKMNFLGTWISWIHACISSASFSLVINKKSSSWFPSH